jgi:hypothetical protein
MSYPKWVSIVLVPSILAGCTVSALPTGSGSSGSGSNTTGGGTPDGGNATGGGSDSGGNAADAGDTTGNDAGGTITFKGSLGTCTSTFSARDWCTDYSYSTTLATDPKTDAAAKAASICTGGSSPWYGTWNDGQTCSRANAIGYCPTESTQMGSAGFYTLTTVNVYVPPSTVADGQANCSTWSTTYPGGS